MTNNSNSFKIHKYSTRYPELFGQYKRLILSILKDIDFEIHHVGSTSVPNLDGKGYIDILISLCNWKKEKEIISRFATIGFTHIHPKENGRIFLSKDPQSQEYDAHVHIVLKNSKECEDMIKFRDILRDNFNIRKEYQNLKYKLEKSASVNRQMYGKEKAVFIEKVLSR